jgi:tRNA modification GTPase
MDGLRLAEPGEFTRRRFENGKLDLTAIEGLADLIGAETEAQRRQAYRHLTGFLGRRVDAWRQQLIETLALVEARIDFSDEGDVPQDLLGPVLTRVAALADEIEIVLADGRRGERLRDGMVVAIAGPPNAGKSTLLNRIARREAAIVSPIPGTTRDIIEVHLDLDGYPVTLLDTAGIRDTFDPVEMEGVRRARERAAAADLTLWVVDSAKVAQAADFSGLPIHTTQIQSLWLVLNKADLPVEKNESKIECNNDIEPILYNNEYEFISHETRKFRISALTGEGVNELIDRLAQEASGAMAAEPSLIARERHRTALETVVAALRRALAEPAQSHDDLLAEELRRAATALGRLTGRIDVEDILDVIFRDFCIGK